MAITLLSRGPDTTKARLDGLALIEVWADWIRLHWIIAALTTSVKQPL
jgi:CHASE2 domain-containing sensor protein